MTSTMATKTNLSGVTVCNAKNLKPLECHQNIPLGYYTVYTSSKSGLRFQKQDLQLDQEPHLPHAAKIVVDSLKLNQEIFGFGGSITDASVINILKLSLPVQEGLLKIYFSDDGLSYNLCRVPIGGCDFSARGYTYNDDHEGDFEMKHFKLAEEDLAMKIPLIKRAKALSSQDVKLVASPWSAPPWMKTNSSVMSGGMLKGEPGGQYYEAWAKYFVRFLEEYKNNGIEFWAVTPQNEPMFTSLPDIPINGMGFSAETQRIFVGKNLGPALEKAGFKDVKIIIYDDLRFLFLRWVKTVLKDPVADRYTSGAAVHWYFDKVTSATMYNEFKQNYPDKFLLMTEACEGAGYKEEKVALGSWIRAENYAENIIEHLQHSVSGWIDWNIALDLQGGPNWVDNFVDSPIIVNYEKDEFYLQPMFYSIAHFSKFIKANSKNIDIETQYSNLHCTAALNPNGSIVLVVLNRQDYRIPLQIQDPHRGYINTWIPERSVQTYCWQ